MESPYKWCQMQGCGSIATHTGVTKLVKGVNKDGSLIMHKARVSSCAFHARHEDLYEVKPIKEES